MYEVLGSFLQTVILLFFYGAVALGGIFAGKWFKAKREDRKKTE